MIQPAGFPSFFFEMSLLKKLFTPDEDYNYYIIFISYLILSICCVLLYVGSLYWEDIKGFWIVVNNLDMHMTNSYLLM